MASRMVPQNFIRVNGEITLRQMAYGANFTGFNTAVKEAVARPREMGLTLAEYLTRFVGNKHVIVKDTHGGVEHIEFLMLLVNTLQSSHKTLFFEPLVEGCQNSPETQISKFFSYFGKSVVQSYTDGYTAINKVINVLPGDFPDAQPGAYPNLRDYNRVRYAINRRIGEKIKLSATPIIAFYGKEHCVCRPNNWAKGIPDYLDPDTFVVLEFIKHPLPRYSHDSKRWKMVDIALDHSVGNQVSTEPIVIHSGLEIDWPDLFIVQHRDDMVYA